MAPFLLHLAYSVICTRGFSVFARWKRPLKVRFILSQRPPAAGGIRSTEAKGRESLLRGPQNSLSLLLLISFSISQQDLAMTKSNIGLRRLVMVLMYKGSTSKKMDQCYFPSCYHVHYCSNYRRSDNGYPRPISSSRTLSAQRERRRVWSWLDRTAKFDSSSKVAL